MDSEAVNSKGAIQVLMLSVRYPDLLSFIRGEGESNWVQNWDANDMLHLLNTWQNGDISQVRDNGDYEKALGSIQAEVLLLPSKTDLFFAVSPCSYVIHRLITEYFAARK